MVQPVTRYQDNAMEIPMREDGHYLIAGLAWMAAWLLSPLVIEHLPHPWPEFCCIAGLILTCILAILVANLWRDE
jgi:hypothetical protein